jgi:hypothetical protein
LLPVYVDKEQELGVMSIAFLLDDKDDAIVWRGPKKSGKYSESCLKQTLNKIKSCINQSLNKIPI